MDYGKAITYVFQDKNWIGVILIGGAIGLLGLFFFWTLIGPILAYALLLGYMMQVIRDVRLDNDAPLPAWEDWGKKLTDGLKLAVAQFLWQLPVIAGGVFLFFGAILMGLLADTDLEGVASAVWGGSYLFFLCFAFLYSLFFLFIMPAITINLTIHDRFSKAFAISDLLDIVKTRLGDLVIIAILTYGLGYLAGMLGLILLLIGLPFTQFWTNLVRGHFYGQLARLVFPPEQETAALQTSSPLSTTD